MTLKPFIYFPKDFINIIPKCQGIRIYNVNTHVISKQNRIRFVSYNLERLLTYKIKKKDQVLNSAAPHVSLAPIQKKYMISQYLLIYFDTYLVN